MPTTQVATGQIATAQHIDGQEETELTTGVMGDCIGLVVIKTVQAARHICLWHVNGGWLDTRSAQYAQMKAFVAPYCQIHVGFGPNHHFERQRREWLRSDDFEDLQANTQVMPTMQPPYPGATIPSPNASVASYKACLTFTCDTLGQVSSNGGSKEMLL